MTTYIFDNGMFYSSKQHISILFLWDVCFIFENSNMRILVIFKITSLKEKEFAIAKKMGQYLTTSCFPMTFILSPQPYTPTAENSFLVKRFQILGCFYPNPKLTQSSIC